MTKKSKSQRNPKLAASEELLKELTAKLEAESLRRRNRTIPMSKNLRTVLSETSEEVLCDLGDEGRDRMAVAKVCLEANRLTLHCGDKGKAAEEEVSRLITKYGYDRVQENAADHVLIHIWIG